jgi:hypothetical protein
MRTMPTDPLIRVKRAAEAKRRAEQEYRSALQDARAAGHSAAEIAGPAGVTRQAVLKTTVPPPRESEAQWRAKAEARLEELDARWEALVDKMAEVERPPDSYIRRETAKRNGRRGKDARKGLRPRPTVLQEARSFAESKLLRALRNHLEDPSVRLVLAELDEAHAIRNALEASFDRSLGIAD